MHNLYKHSDFLSSAVLYKYKFSLNKQNWTQTVNGTDEMINYFSKFQCNTSTTPLISTMVKNLT